MGLFFRSRFSFIKKYINYLPHFSSENRYSLICLNIAQFGGVLNDNIFKFVMAFLLIQILGKDKASNILSATGAIFVIPFLLFSSAAGVLADRYSKQRLLVLMKIGEILIMLLAIWAFSLRSVWACYVLLFLLSTHSAAFGPSKYGIIPEIVGKDKVSRANGLITSFTYLGIIVGTFLASFLTEITDRNYPLTVAFCLIIAVIGFLSTFGIKKTNPQGSKKIINPLFLQEIYQTLKFSLTRKHLIFSIFGSSFFLFIGGFTQLNIIPFTIQSLKLSEVDGGYLFLPTALGIAIGALVAGKASKLRIELGISCIAGFFIGIFFLLITLFSTNLPIVVLLLILIGIAGGVFIVPFDSFTQLSSTDIMRGQVIAAANFLSFCGVLLAAVALFIFSDILFLSAAGGFAVMGVLTILVSIFLTLRLSDLSLSFFSRVFLHRLYGLQKINADLVQQKPSSILLLDQSRFSDFLFVLESVPNVHIVFPKQEKSHFPWFNRLFYSLHLMPFDDKMNVLEEIKARIKEKEATFCLVASHKQLKKISQMLETTRQDLLYVKVHRPQRRYVDLIFSKKPMPENGF